MIMVEIDSSAILVEPMKIQKDAKMIRAYNALLLQLKQAGITPKNMSWTMKYTTQRKTIYGTTVN